MFDFLLIFCGVVLFVLALIVLYSNSRAPTNRWLSAFMISGLLWLVANLLTNSTHDSTKGLLFARSALVGASLIPLTFLFFCYSFTNQPHKLTFLKRCLIFLPVLLLLISTPTPLNISDISADNQSFQPGLAFVVLMAVLVTYFWKGISLLVHDYRRAKDARKRQLYYILIGVTLTVVPGILLNGILPLLGFSQAAEYGSVVVIFFSIFTSIAIVRHRLLDVRLLVARSLAYSFSLVSLGGIFALGTFGLTNIFFPTEHSNTATLRWLYAIFAIILALIFPTLKQFFDKVTNRLFFRDAYDTQVFLDDFNKTLVITYELDQLLKKSAQIIEENLKPTYCLFVINATENTKQRIRGSGERNHLEQAYLDDLQKALSHTKQKLIVSDELEESHGALQKHLRQEDVVLLARLTASSSGHKPDVGYLMIGPKKSGNLYSSQDLKVIEIIANELVIAVQNALRFEEIEHFNITLQGKVDDATKKLRKVNEKLRQLDETKDDFISMASHQLRTPLTSVKGYISMVMEGDAGKLTHMQREMLGQAFFSSQRMVYLIADLLNVSRLKTGKFVIEPTSVNLAEVVEQELSQLEETAASHQINLTYDKPKNFPSVMLDETKTRQVIMNFVDNAIYYTPAKGHIDVQLTDDHGTIQLKVVDDGIGVPKSEQPHLFTKFYRAGNARKARPDGTGLGLFMAKKVVVAQGGSLIFESQEGKGSTFGFTFSKHKLSAHAHPVKNDQATEAEPAHKAPATAKQEPAKETATKT